MAYTLAHRHLPGLGTILDYQVPFKHALHDNAGKIDLIADDGAALYLLELKQGNSSETLLRCVLEILTDWHTPGGMQSISGTGGSKARKTAPVSGSDGAARQFPTAKHLPELTALVERAVRLATSTLPDEEARRTLGEGWVAEETLAIAVYCALKYKHDFYRALIAAVNHIPCNHAQWRI